MRKRLPRLLMGTDLAALVGAACSTVSAISTRHWDDLVQAYCITLAVLGGRSTSTARH